MRLRPWVFVSIGVFSTLLACGGYALAKDALRPQVKGSTHAIVAITAVNGRSVLDNRTAFEIKESECRLRLRMISNDDPDARFVVGALEGTQWQPVSGEVSFGNMPNAEISFPVSSLPAAGTVPVAIFERRDGKCSGTIDLITRRHASPVQSLFDERWFTWVGLLGLLFTFLATKSLDSLWEILKHRKSGPPAGGADKQS